MKELTENENVKKLIEAFDLELPSHYLNVSDWGLDDSGRIVIYEIKVFDNKGKFIKLADMKRVVGSLDKFPTTFKRNGN